MLLYMRILIISTSFAPDNGIASKRTSMFAKYLLKLGHDVSVIRSGLVFGIAEKCNLKGLETARIYSYEGHDCAAEQFERNEAIAEYKPDKVPAYANKKKAAARMIRFFGKTGHVILDPFTYYREKGLRISKLIRKLYDENQKIRGFDVVISSFGPIGCVEGGEYIRDRESARWIIDFRDLMDNQTFTPINRLINGIRQKRYVRLADACLCVSEGNGNRLSGICRGQYAEKVKVLYNGYENKQDDELRSENDSRFTAKDRKLHICYTGILYGGRRDCSPLFRAIREIKRDIPIRIDYAGQDGELLKLQAAACGYEDMIDDHGYLSRTEVNKLQEAADLFLVLSWNTRNDQGILTGKFYEALQHRKPIIALVAGDTPDSELKMLIDRYHLGVCYEEAEKEPSIKRLRDYLDKQISRKQLGETMEYNPDESVFSRFQYQEIAKQLEQIMEQIVKE